MSFSTKLEKFISENAPEEISWSAEEIRSIAAQAGMEVVTEGSDILGNRELSEHEFAVLFHNSGEKEYCYGIFDSRKVTKVTWEALVSGKTLTFISKVRLFISAHGVSSTVGEIALKKAAGLKGQEVELPEETTKLPSVPWHDVYAVDWGSGEIVDDRIYFLSEAKIAAAIYITDLLDRIGVETSEVVDLLKSVALKED